MAAASFLALIPFVAGVQAARQPASHAAKVLAGPAGIPVASWRSSRREAGEGLRPLARTAGAANTYRGLSARQWAARFRDRTRELQAARRQAHALRRTLTHTSTVTEAINLSCAAYGNCTWLWRIARCESGLDARIVNAGSGSSGLFQFLPSTWATTPFGSFSIWSPYASALAAGWMVTHGRGGEWVCR